MGSGFYSLDPERNKNKIFLIAIIVLIVMIAIAYYAIIYLEKTGATYKEQIVLTDDYINALASQ